MIRLKAATWVGLASLIAACGAPSDTTGTRQEAIIGGSGAVTVSTAGTIVNKYYYALTADAAAGAVTLSLSGSTGIAAGDLVMLVQMQGATIDTSNTAAYGTVSALGGAGTYELVSITGVNTTANTITVDDSCGGLKHGYSAAGKTQVIFVPQYSSLTIANGASVTAPAWNGATGGVVALTASTTVTLTGSGKITANGIGFRGGVMDANTTTEVDTGGHNQYVGTNTVLGAEKGEGIAGFGAQLGAAGFLGRGAPANGGGGGDNHNGGGGGGANGGVTSGSGTWTGAGSMNGAAGGATAWTLDPEYLANGNALTTSPGGGRGGYTYSANKLAPTTNGPGLAGWGGDDRYDHGGLGGRPLTSDPTSTIFLGGGGGAGDSNNSTGGGGGAGGGIVFVIAGTSVTATTTGAITANGAAGGNTTGNGNDAPGGGGAGGSIIVSAPTISGVTFAANGGTGGLQAIAASLGNEAEGPGGGGGGGFIALSGGTSTATATGGGAGTTNSPGVTPFTVNGATDGTAGTVSVAAFAAPLCEPSLGVTITNTSPAIPGDPITYTITVVNDSAGAGALATNVVDTLPALTGVTWSCVATAGSSCTPASGAGAVSEATSIAQGGTLTYTVTGTIAPTATNPFTLTATATAGALSSTASDTVPLAPASDLSVVVTATPEPDAIDDTLT
ncbi:MAG TPA: hypothetical protein VIA18_29680, partial [Polyangia bacterium]|nr:hypothetical protein [Polyangia bacterium]